MCVFLDGESQKNKAMIRNLYGLSPPLFSKKGVNKYSNFHKSQYTRSFREFLGSWAYLYVEKMGNPGSTSTETPGLGTPCPGRWSVLFNHILYNNLVNIRTASQVALLAKSLPVDAEDTRDTDLIPGLGKYGGGHGNPRQYSCLENPMDRGSWQGTNQARKESVTQLSAHTHTHISNHFPEFWEATVAKHPIWGKNYNNPPSLILSQEDTLWITWGSTTCV